MQLSAKGTIGAINLITLDFIYSNLARIPRHGEEVSTGSFTLSLGGGPVAALVAAGRLGATTKLATSLSNGHISNIARVLLEQEQINYHSFYEGEGANGEPVNITSVMTFEKQDRAFVSYFPQTRFYSAYATPIFNYLQNCNIVIASSPNKQLFKALSQQGCRIVYDVGWSDDLSLDDLAEIMEYIYLFSPNEMEALKMTGAPTAEKALEQLARHITQPVVKLGSNGALVWKNGKAVLVPPAPFTPVDTTGAGDAFLGGVAYGLLNNWDILDCVKLGNYTGGKATTQIGCTTAHVTLQEYLSWEGKA